MKARSAVAMVAASLVLASCAAGEPDRETAEKITDRANGNASGADKVEALLLTPVVELNVEQVSDLLDSGNVRLIDVRRDDEVAEGMIPGAEQIVLDDFDPAKLDLSDGREVVLYCRSGRRSGIAAEKLAAHTGKPAKHLAGGIIAWREAGKDTAPLVE